MDMTKFTSADDPGFVAVCGELRRWIRDIDTAERNRENLPLSNNRDRNEQLGMAQQYGEGNRQFNNFGGSQKNIEGGNYKSGGGAMYISIVPPKEPTGGKGL